MAEFFLRIIQHPGKFAIHFEEPSTTVGGRYSDWRIIESGPQMLFTESQFSFAFSQRFLCLFALGDVPDRRDMHRSAPAT